LRVEKENRKRGLDVVGYYHSHPDHPARPSEYDRAHAWPWYSYVIVSVERGEPKAMTSWMLSEDRSRFDEETLETV
jgi:proteasome lid subunit RPN8/RPN11